MARQEQDNKRSRSLRNESIGIADLASNLNQLKYWIRVGNFSIYTIRVPGGKNIENEGQHLKE